MYKLLILLMLINVSFSLQANWQKNQFKLNTSYKISSSEQLDIYNERSTIQQIELTANKVSLLDGAGLGILASLSPYTIEQQDLEKNSGTEHSLRAQGILFLSSTSDVSATYSDSKQLQHFEGRLDNQLIGLPQEMESRIKNAELSLSLGKDKSFFYLDFLYQKSKVEKETLVANELVNQLDKTASSIDLLWRQSESTLWGTRVEVTKTERQLFSDEYNFDVNNYYLSSVIEYLGSSQLKINLGSSEVSTEKQFSWDVEHKTYLSDHMNFSLRSYRKFDVAINNSQLEDLNTHYEANFNYEPLDYIKTGFSYYQEQRKQNNEETYDRKSVGGTVAFHYQESWVFSATYASERVTDHLNNNELTQNIVQFTVSRALI